MIVRQGRIFKVGGGTGLTVGALVLQSILTHVLSALIWLGVW
jgi:hypothetical protein